MIVRFTPAPGALMSVRTKSGKTISHEEIESVDVVPFFSLPQGNTDTLYGVSLTNKEAELYRFLVQAKGTNGQVKCYIRPEKSVIPLVDREDRKPRPKKSNPQPVETK